MSTAIELTELSALPKPHKFIRKNTPVDVVIDGELAVHIAGLTGFDSILNIAHSRAIGGVGHSPTTSVEVISLEELRSDLVGLIVKLKAKPDHTVVAITDKNQPRFAVYPYTEGARAEMKRRQEDLEEMAKYEFIDAEVAVRAADHAPPLD